MFTVTTGVPGQCHLAFFFMCLSSSNVTPTCPSSELGEQHLIALSHFTVSISGDASAVTRSRQTNSRSSFVYDLRACTHQSFLRLDAPL